MKNLPLISITLSSVALLLSAYSILKPNALGKGISSYDLSSPEKALTSSLRMKVDGNYLAYIEYELGSPKEKGDAEEVLQNLEVHDTEDYDGKKILFVSYTKDGEKTYDIEGFQKASESGSWYRSRVSVYDMPSGSEMRNRIQKWKAKKEDK